MYEIVSASNRMCQKCGACTLVAESDRSYLCGCGYENGAKIHGSGSLENHRQEQSSATALDVQVGGDHYKKYKIQPVEYAHANGLDFLSANIVKYATRHRDKGGAQDIKKIKHYCDLILKLDYWAES